MTTSTGTRPAGRPAAGFVHQNCIYDSDQAFLAVAVPFVDDGLVRGDPVLVTTTPANLAVLADALGARAQRVDYAETAYFGRRPPQRIAAFHRYWQRHAVTAGAGGGQVRILAEPVWTGKSDADIAAWTRMEGALNVLLAATNIRMICPYDARVLQGRIVADSRRTHPQHIAGDQPSPSGEFLDPAAYTS